MGIIYGLVSGKGGVAKTTTTQNLLAGFHIQEQSNWTYKLGDPIPQLEEDESPADLGIDLDPSMNLTKGSGVQIETSDPSAHEMLLNPDYGIAYMLKRAGTGYDLVPSASSMDNIEQELNNDQVVGRDRLLDIALREAEGAKDYAVPWQATKKYRRVFVDTPRNLGILAVNVLVASDVIFVPFQPEVYSDDAVDRLEERIAQVRRLKKSVDIHGVIITMYDARLTLHQEVVRKMRNRFGEKVFKTMIPRNVRVAEAPAFRKSVIEYDPSSPGAIAYMNLVKEIKERHG